VKAHQGTIIVKSEHLSGCTFVITLPLIK
jgi:signal transduction histidine kinase